MKGHRLLTGCMLLGALLPACGDDKPTTAATAAKGPAKPKTAAPVAPASATAIPPRVRLDENDFAENDRSRDPFRSYVRAFAEEGKGRSRSQRDVVLPEYSIDELRLIGIVTRMQPAKAMLVDPTGKGYVIQRGQFVGRADIVQGAARSGSNYEVNWRVDRIREGDVVLVREDPTNPDIPILTRVIPLRPEGSLVGP